MDVEKLSRVSKLKSEVLTLIDTEKGLVAEVHTRLAYGNNVVNQCYAGVARSNRAWAVSREEEDFLSLHPVVTSD